MTDLPLPTNRRLTRRQPRQVPRPARFRARQLPQGESPTRSTPAASSRTDLPHPLGAPTTAQHAGRKPDAPYQRTGAQISTHAQESGANSTPLPLSGSQTCDQTGPPSPPPRTAERTHVHRRATLTPPPESLFLRRFPMLRHVPPRTRQQLSDQFARLIWDAVRERDTRAQVRAFLIALAFPICMLLSPASQRHSDAPKVVQSTRALIKDRLKKWTEGHTSALWQTAMQPARRLDLIQRAHNSPSCNRKSAMTYAQDGAYMKAVQVLQSFGVYEPTASVLKAL